MTKKLSLGGPLTRPECDKCLGKLALALPRAGVTPDQAHDTLDLYFSLLSRAGVTGKMLITATERYIMAPTGGRPKFFPDPGQLAELCADDIRERRRDLEGLDNAMALLERSPAVEPEPDNVARLERLRGIKEGFDLQSPREPPTIPSTARAETDVTELKAHLEKKLAS